MAKKILMVVLLALSGLAVVLMMGAKDPNCDFIYTIDPPACVANPVGSNQQVCCKSSEGFNVTFINECFCTYNGGTVQYSGSCK